MNLRSGLCVLTFSAAYILLIPGLWCTLFSVKAIIPFLGIQTTIMEKSTLGAIHLLMEKERWAAGLTILICSVIAPFAKLAVLLVCVYIEHVRGNAGPGVAHAITVVRRISKWATVDAFTACILVGFFCNNSMIKVGLYKGFYCFVGYCIFSVAGALLLQRPDEAMSNEQRGLVTAANSTPKAVMPAIGVSFVLIAVLVIVSLVPIFDVECSMIGLQEHFSYRRLVDQLGRHGSYVAASLCIGLVAVVPAADLVWSVVEARYGRSKSSISEWLQDFAMLDVFALAALVATNAASGVHSGLVVRMLPGGWFLIIFAGFWLLSSLLLRSRPGGMVSSVIYGMPSKKNGEAINGQLDKQP